MPPAAGVTATRGVDDGGGPQQGGQRMLLVVHARFAVAEPRALHPSGRRRVTGLGGIGLLADREAGDARCPLGQGGAQVG